MAILNKNCFLKGFFVGQALREGRTCLPDDGKPYNPHTRLPGTEDYDKGSFLSGLAAGLAGTGRMYRAFLGKIGLPVTRLSSTDELLCEMYILDMLGELEVPKLPGMTKLQEWMASVGFNDPTQYAERLAAFGGDSDRIAWAFYQAELAELAYDDDTEYPVNITSQVVLGSGSHDVYDWYNSWTATGLRAALTAAPRIRLNKDIEAGTAEITATATTNGYTHLNAGCYHYLKIDHYTLPPGVYRLTCLETAITPTPEQYGLSTKQYAELHIIYKNHVSHTSGVSWSDAWYPASRPVSEWWRWYRVPAGESVTFKVTNPFGWTYSPPYENNSSRPQIEIEAVLSQNGYDNVSEPNPQTLHVLANTEYTQHVKIKLELLEKYPYTSDDDATLTEVLEKADESKLYYLSNDDGISLKPTLLIDQTNDTVRDRDAVQIDDKLRVSPDIKYGAENVEQINNTSAIVISADPSDGAYHHTFSDYDSDYQSIQVDKTVGNMRYSFNKSDAVGVTLYSEEPGSKGSTLSDSKTYRIRRVDDS